ncbi:MAG: heparan-alpha-glucosaminide N-acetyltransferase domain-containing protein [Planctomycetota bacterium]
MTEAAHNTEATPPKPPRLASLDAMRGFVIASMLIVNMTWDRDALPSWLFHVPWNDPTQGATFADLVFPWFVFMAGCAAPLSMRAGRGRGISSGRMLRVAFWRAAKLYLIGVLLTVASFANERPLQWHDVLSWNILQLLAAAYFVTVAVMLLPTKGRVAFIAVVLLAKWSLFLLSYEAVTSLAAVRPAEGGPVGPGTWAHFDAVKQLLHAEFLADPTWWQRLLGWFGMAQQYLPLAAIAVVGALTTEQLNDHRNGRTVCRFLGLAVALIAIGFVLQYGYDPAGGGLWGLATVPFSKWFFSPAYCLLAAGSGVALLAGFYFLTDLAKLAELSWLRAQGKNALAIYVGAELSFKLIFARWQLPLPDGGSDSIAASIQAWIGDVTGSPAVASLGWAVLWTAAWASVAWRLDRRGLYWRA